MSTRGAIGFYRDDHGDKITYNHFDSYPSELGTSMLRFIQETNLGVLNAAYERIILVDPEKHPTRTQIEECKDFTDLNVSKGSLTDWYCLLHDSQGDLYPYTRWTLRYMIDSRDFMKDSLFCEWAYVINLSTECLEVYEGLNHEISLNRYEFTKKEVKEILKEAKEIGRDPYYNVKLIQNYPLSSLPTAEHFCKECEPDVADDE